MPTYLADAFELAVKTECAIMIELGRPLYPQGVNRMDYSLPTSIIVRLYENNAKLNYAIRRYELSNQAD